MTTDRRRSPTGQLRVLATEVRKEGRGFKIALALAVLAVVVMLGFLVTTVFSLTRPEEAFTTDRIDTGQVLCPGQPLVHDVGVEVNRRPATVITVDSWYDNTTGEYLPIPGSITGRTFAKDTVVNTVPISLPVPQIAELGHSMRLIRGITSSNGDRSVVSLFFQVGTKEVCNG